MSPFKSICLLVTATFCIAGCGRTVSIEAQRGPQLFAERWRSGDATTEPALQTQAIDERTFAIRQSIRTTFEAPFVYLLIGRDRALLIDTGVAGSALRIEVDRLLKERGGEVGRSLPLIVMHTHGHSDHVGGDAGFKDRPATQIVGHGQEEVVNFFGLGSWPHRSVALDLGERLVDIVPTPGHHAAHVMVYDRATRILFGGDAVYPGILRFQCAAATEYLASIKRVIAFSERNDIKWILGGHIEMKAAAGEYFESQDVPRSNERRLELPSSVLREIRDSLVEMGDRPRVKAFPDFLLFPHPADPGGRQPPDWCDA